MYDDEGSLRDQKYRSWDEIKFPHFYLQRIFANINERIFFSFYLLF